MRPGIPATSTPSCSRGRRTVQCPAAIKDRLSPQGHSGKTNPNTFERKSHENQQHYPRSGAVRPGSRRPRSTCTAGPGRRLSSPASRLRLSNSTSAVMQPEGTCIPRNSSTRTAIGSPLTAGKGRAHDLHELWNEAHEAESTGESITIRTDGSVTETVDQPGWHPYVTATGHNGLIMFPTDDAGRSDHAPSTSGRSSTPSTPHGRFHAEVSSRTGQVSTSAPNSPAES